MDSQKRRFPPFLIYLIFIAALIIGAIVISRTANRSTQVSYSDYIKDLEDGYIKKAEIQQNNEVPTGVVYYTTSEAERASVKSVPVPDVTEELAEDLYNDCRISEFGDYSDPVWEHKYIYADYDFYARKSGDRRQPDR